MSKYAKVTLRDGTSHRVKVVEDPRGVRFYAYRKKDVYLLAGVEGLKVQSFGETRRTERNGPRVKLPVAFSGGDLPESFATIERISCGCSSPLPGFRAPREWEEVTV